MSDWEVGDLAMCIHSDPWWNQKGEIIAGPAFGAILTVIDVLLIRASDDKGNYREDLCLRFEDWNTAFEAVCFLKITPPAADEFDHEIIAALTGQPEQVPA